MWLGNVVYAQKETDAQRLVELNESLQKYDRKTLFAMVQEAQANVSPKLVQAVHSFTDCVQSGLQVLSKKPQCKFISIGQSPAVIAEALSVSLNFIQMEFSPESSVCRKTDIRDDSVF